MAFCDLCEQRILNNGEDSYILLKDQMAKLVVDSSVLDAFKNNEFVVIHGDRYMPGTNTISISFLGKPAKFPSGPLYLASKYNVPVTFVYTVKDSATHYHFYATPGKVFPYPSNIKTRKQNITGMVESYVSSLENIVKKYPLQWFNYHHFWEEETIK